MRRFKTYLSLTKPGIIRGNLVTATAGYFLAAQTNIQLDLLAAMLIGLSCIIASACASNNLLDKDIDTKMSRTKNRALVTGTVTSQEVVIFAFFLGAAGVTILGLFTNLLTLSLAVLGYVLYVVIYGIYKRRTRHGTLIGSLSGAIPPVVGYCSVSNQLDIAALLLFIILIFWQMPHFYAIAMHRSKDYAAASIPVLPVVKSFYATKIQILLYIVGFVVSALSLAIFNYTGTTYVITVILLGAVWLILAVGGFSAENDRNWAHQMFLYSLIVILLLCSSIIIDSL